MSDKQIKGSEKLPSNADGEIASQNSYGRIQLTQGQSTIVDESDFESLKGWKWCAMYCSSSKSFYARRYRNGKIVAMQNVIMSPAKGYVVDHINGNTLDNRRSNLRVVSRKHNSWNKKMPSTNTTGFKGVYRTKRGRRPFEARIKVNQKQIYLRSFHTAEEASAAYEKAALHYFGPFCRSQADDELIPINRTAPRAHQARNSSGDENIAWRDGAWRVEIYRDGKKHNLGRHRSKKKARQVKRAFLRGEPIELPKININNSSGEKHISRYRNNTWAVEITVKSKRYRRNGIRTMEEAKSIRDAMYRKLGLIA
jgi:hypothetical protein